MSNDVPILISEQISAQEADMLRNARQSDVKRVFNALSYEEKEAQKKAARLRVLQAHAPRTSEELWKAVYVLFGLKFPYTATTEDAHAPFQWFSDVYFGRAEQSVALASRGSGKTLGLSMLAYLWGTYIPNWSTRHAAADREQAEVASGYLTDWSHDPVLRTVFSGKPYRFSARWSRTNANWKVVTGSMGGVSGQHPNAFTADEIEFWSIDAIMQTFFVPVERDGGRHRVWAVGSTRQRCLHGSVRILTEHGYQKISRVVNSKYAGKVLSQNPTTGKWEWKTVTGWYRNGSSREWYHFHLAYGQKGRGAAVRATKEHHFYYDVGKKKSADTFKVGDSFVVPSWIPSAEQRAIIVGTLLGDASLNKKGELHVEHSVKQLSYIQWKHRALSDVARSELHHVVSRDHYKLHCSPSAYTHRLRREWYPEGVKRIPDYVWDELTPLALAVWLMDDGSYRKTTSGADTWHIYTNHFNEHERERMTTWFDQHGMQITWYRTEKDQYYAYLGGDNACTLSAMVAPYIKLEKNQGTRSGWKTWVGNDIETHGDQGFEKVPITRIDVVNTPPSGAYDITVEDNHNFVVGGARVLASNSFGAMNWLYDVAPSKNIKQYRWTAFEIMKPCQTCVAIDENPHGSDEARMQSCNLWDDCHGERARKATGWINLERIQQDKRNMGGSGSDNWRTQGLCEKPSSHGLVLHNFEHDWKPDGNYSVWTYNPDLPWYAVHDPAEGKKSVILFFQISGQDIFIFDELIQPKCPDVTTAKDAFYEKCLVNGYTDPELIIVDPHRSDAAATWQAGTEAGEGMNHRYRAVLPDISSKGHGQLIHVTTELLRRWIRGGDTKRHLFVNPHRCPGLVRGIKEHHYKTDMQGNIMSDIPSPEYKDEVDTLRYLVMWASTKVMSARANIAFV